MPGLPAVEQVVVERVAVELVAFEQVVVQMDQQLPATVVASLEQLANSALVVVAY